MKYLFFGLIFFMFSMQVVAQDLTARQIDQKMSEIRESTNWDNPDEAKKANNEIKKLSDLLLHLGPSKKTSTDDGTKTQGEQNKEYNMNLFKQMMKTADKGKGADVLLAEPLREEIVEEYKDDESQRIRHI